MAGIIVHYLILSTKEWRGLFRGGAVIGTFVAHLSAAQGAKRVPKLEVGSNKPPYSHSYGALALSAARVSQYKLSFIDIKYYFLGSACSPPLCDGDYYSSNDLQHRQATKSTSENI